MKKRKIIDYFSSPRKEKNTVERFLSECDLDKLKKAKNPARETKNGEYTNKRDQTMKNQRNIAKPAQFMSLGSFLQRNSQNNTFINKYAAARDSESQNSHSKDLARRTGTAELSNFKAADNLKIKSPDSSEDDFSFNLSDLSSIEDLEGQTDQHKVSSFNNSQFLQNQAVKYPRVLSPMYTPPKISESTTVSDQRNEVKEISALKYPNADREAKICAAEYMQRTDTALSVSCVKAMDPQLKAPPSIQCVKNIDPRLEAHSQTPFPKKERCSSRISPCKPEQHRVITSPPVQIRKASIESSVSTTDQSRDPVETDSDPSRFKFLNPILDANRNPVNSPNYDPSTLYISEADFSKLTNFEKQFWEIKKNYFDTVIFFKKGKFYELFEKDADIGSSFGLKLTNRVNMRMAGIPESSFNDWAAKFLKAGYKIGRVDQRENMVGKKIRQKNEKESTQISIKASKISSPKNSQVHTGRGNQFLPNTGFTEHKTIPKTFNKNKPARDLTVENTSADYHHDDQPLTHIQYTGNLTASNISKNQNSVGGKALQLKDNRKNVRNYNPYLLSISSSELFDSFEGTSAENLRPNLSGLFDVDDESSSDCYEESIAQADSSIIGRELMEVITPATIYDQSSLPDMTVFLGIFKNINDRYATVLYDSSTNTASIQISMLTDVISLFSQYKIPEIISQDKFDVDTRFIKPDVTGSLFKYQETIRDQLFTLFSKNGPNLVNDMPSGTQTIIREGLNKDLTRKFDPQIRHEYQAMQRTCSPDEFPTSGISPCHNDGNLDPHNPIRMKSSLIGYVDKTDPKENLKVLISHFLDCFLFLYNHLVYLKRKKAFETLNVQFLCSTETFMVLDGSTIKNLDLLSNKSLFDTINHCVTPQGKRLLKSWMLRPLMNIDNIRLRQEAALILGSINKESIFGYLKSITDTQRIMTRLFNPNPSVKNLKSFIDNLNQVTAFVNSFENILVLNYGDLENLSMSYMSDLSSNDNFFENSKLSEENPIRPHKAGLVYLAKILRDCPRLDSLLAEFNKNFAFNNDEITIHSLNHHIYGQIENLRRSELDLVKFLENQKKFIEEINSTSVQLKEYKFKSEYIESNQVFSDVMDSSTAYIASSSFLDSDLTRQTLNRSKNPSNNRIKSQSRTDLQCFEICYRDIGKDIFQIEVPAHFIMPNEYFLVSSTKDKKRYYTHELKRFINVFVENEEILYQKKSSLLKSIIKKFKRFRDVCIKVDYFVSKIDCLFSFSIYNSLNSETTYPAFVTEINEASDKPIPDQGGKSSGFSNNYCLYEFVDIKCPMYPLHVPNTLRMYKRMCVITGPNMGGKSTTMRSICLNIILAQMGMKVSAKHYKSILFDRIFTKLGTGDNLLEKKSTFQIELEDTARIIKESTVRSFIIIDELGRGTSTKEGECIAKAVLNWLIRNNRTCLFSTHYTRILSPTFCVNKINKNHIEGNPRGSNVLGSTIGHSIYNQGNSVQENGPFENADSTGYMTVYLKCVLGKDLLFLYSIEEGICRESQALEVARIAGVHPEILQRAQYYKNILERK